VFAVFQKMAVECESSASESSARSKRRHLLEVLLHSESSSKGKANFKVSCKFCREEFTHHGAMSSMHEHLKH